MDRSCRFESLIQIAATIGLALVVPSTLGCHIGSCRSNTTHLCWSTTTTTTTANKDIENDDKRRATAAAAAAAAAAAVSSRRTAEAGRAAIMPESTCRWQTKSDAKKELYNYLRQHVMQFDFPFLETMGFQEEEENLPDGLDQGMIGETIAYALQAKIEFDYSDRIPEEVFREYVLNYANTNEARSNWRPLLWKKLRSLIQQQQQQQQQQQPPNNYKNDIADVVQTVNANLWSILAPADQNVIYFKSQSTPLVFDPMSILAFGYASCTGTSILLVNALRTLGVPARLVGTAAWNQQRSKGNHNWVEVWVNDDDNYDDDDDGRIHDTTTNGRWYFVEPSLSTDPNTAATVVDDLTRDPCQRWFCHRSQFTGHESNTTLVYAARLEPAAHSTFYPLAWEWTNQAVPGEDVSHSYWEQCGHC